MTGGHLAPGPVGGPDGGCPALRLVGGTGRRLDIGEARRALRGVAESHDWGVDLDDLELLASEVLTNAVRYTASGRRGGGVDVRLLVRDDCLRVEVTDDGGARTVPHLVESSDWQESGRGLLMVAVLAADWGWSAERSRTTVWFELLRKE
ncbi:ATP-binding protein [Actinomadura oligospora]|uniref:ATP-binding protein n=1 Tax=Actinomadura oligospora TaxID=111804 RepID=UPI0004B45D3E|nr:ATP-binding protein [Actinomadura oligospora]